MAKTERPERPTLVVRYVAVISTHGWVEEAMAKATADLVADQLRRSLPNGMTVTVHTERETIS